MKAKKQSVGSPTIPKLLDSAPDPEEQVLCNLAAALDAYLTLQAHGRSSEELKGVRDAPAKVPAALVVFRWPEPLVKALLEACRRRKMAGTKPFTQRELTVQAMQEWLDRHAIPPSPKGLSHD
jgi:hypothetical protein